MKFNLLAITLLMASTSLYALEESATNTLKVTDSNAPTPSVSLDKSDVSPTQTSTTTSIDPENKAGTVSADQTPADKSTKMLNATPKESASDTKTEPTVLYKNKHPDNISGEYDYDPNYED